MVIVEYNQEWPTHFQKIAEELKKYLSSNITIEHIGSTAIEGMCAKPIIDLVILVQDDHHFQQIKHELEINFGYFHVGDWGIAGREVFKRKNSFRLESKREQKLVQNNVFKHEGKIPSKILDTISHNLYVCKIGAEEVKRYRLFRDYLQNNREARLEYCQIKQEIIKQYGNDDYEMYCQIKEENYTLFFKEIINRAIPLDIYTN